ncbi:Uncharacterized protein B5E39_3128 [Bacillus cereus]|nr:Uncharacterized protein B5E39_3128 [Bacillus cereus]
MIKTRTVILVVFIAIIFCFSIKVIFGDKPASNTESSTKVKDATSEPQKEKLSAQLDTLDYNKETNKLKLSLTTNIPDSTKATIKYTVQINQMNTIIPLQVVRYLKMVNYKQLFPRHNL